MTTPRTFHRPNARWLLPALLALTVACDSSTTFNQGPDRDDLDGDGADDFVSDVPGSGGTDDSAGSNGGVVNGGGTGGTGAEGPSDGEDPADPGRAIAEADIIQIDGDKLYALSRYAGLTIIDVENPKKLRTLGNYRVNATPFEMYLREGIAYVMFNGFGTYVHDDESGYGSWETTSRMQALDVTNPAKVKVIGDEEIPGSISDSRMVGDVVYLATYEDGYCWDCERNQPNTRVASFDVSDPSKFVAVDELRFMGESESWGPRSITVTDQRMYVAGPTWANRDSSIQVVDISDPSGDLKLGADVPIHGSVRSRWQMDEYEGVLRVITQPTTWRSNDPPHVQTFEVVSSDEVTKLASLAVKLPRPEDLQSVRFDGPRAYAITFEQIDPLFTFDLTDPAAPKQMGELEIPGFVYHMEPRGDRIYALGFDNASKEGALHVSIFDVSQLDKPVMLDRVNFGGDWASVAEDQDRIHKAFNILLDQGLILVPFSGGEYEEATCNYDYKSGIQLVDVAGDDLTLRGVAPQIGDARRALMHREHLFGITDNAVQVFDIADRDAPKETSSLEVARNITQLHVMGDTLMRFGTDWWTNRAMLDFTRLDDASTAEPMGQLDLSEFAAEPENMCGSGANWQGQAFVHGDVAYVPRRQTVYREQSGKPFHRESLLFYIVDLSNPEQPELIDTFSVHSDASSGGYLGDVVLTDSALLVGRREGYYSYGGSPGQGDEPRYSYDIFDLKDPRKPRFAKRFQVPSQMAYGGWGYGFGGCSVDMAWGWYSGSGALVSGDLVISQHEEAVKGGAGRVRYFLDRLDVSNPDKPKLLAPINIPGQVVHYDGENERVVTLDYRHRTLKAKDYQQCNKLGQGWFDSRTGVCHLYERRAHLLELDGDRAVRTSLVYLDNQERISASIAVSDQRLFYTSHERGTEYWNSGVEHMEALAFDDEGRFERLPSAELVERTEYWAQLYARGTRAFLSSSSRMQVIDARDTENLKVKSYDTMGWGCSSLEVHEDKAFCALGQYGVATFDLE